MGKHGGRLRVRDALMKGSVAFLDKLAEEASTAEMGAQISDPFMKIVLVNILYSLRRKFCKLLLRVELFPTNSVISYSLYRFKYAVEALLSETSQFCKENGTAALKIGDDQLFSG